MQAAWYILMENTERKTTNEWPNELATHSYLSPQKIKGITKLFGDMQ